MAVSRQQHVADWQDRCVADSCPLSGFSAADYWIPCPQCTWPIPKCRLSLAGHYKPSGDNNGVDLKRVVTFCDPHCSEKVWLPPITDACGYMRFVLGHTEAEIRKWRSAADLSLAQQRQHVSG